MPTTSPLRAALLFSVLAAILLCRLLAAEEPHPSFPGVLVMKDGRKLKGEITDRGDVFEVRLKFGVSRVKKEEVERIDKDEGKPAAASMQVAVEFIEPYYGTVVFKDGRRIAGDIVERAGKVEIHRKIGMVRIERELVERIEKSDPPPAPAPRPTPAAGEAANAPTGAAGTPAAEPAVAPPAEAEPESAPPIEAPSTTGGPKTTDPKLRALAEEANQALASCLRHHARFRESRDEKVRKTEILAALQDIRKAAGTFAGLLEAVGDDAWLEERYHASIEIFKEVRMRAGLYK
ncbi:MAG: hypothetical protein HYZ53_29450 [Planctomycetes bacterium]|nr:hypothetical protein [Planctomycetota bacterium]